MTSPASYRQFLDRPLRTFFLLWTPVLFSMVAEPLTGLVDTAFVARLGSGPLAALGVGTVVLTGGLWLFNFLSVGSQTEVSQACGRQDLERGRHLGSLALFLALLIGSAMGLLFVLFAPQLAALMGATELIHDHAVTYIRLRGFGGPAVLLTMTSFGILYGLADMRSPLLIALAVNGLNIVLDYLLIFGAGPVPPMGIAGAALASTASQWSGVVLCGISIRKKLGITLMVDMGDVKRLLTIGHDMILRTGSLILFLVLATRGATLLGPESGGAHQAIRQAWIFAAFFLDASAVTAQSLIGYFFGSGLVVRARKVALFSCRWSLMLGAVLTTTMIAGAEAIGALLVPPAGLALFFPAWTVAALFQPVAALAFVTDGIHWGTGDFAYLRNCVVIATVSSSAALLALELLEVGSLTHIWWITGGWISIRAGLNLLRIWPGIGNGPLRSEKSVAPA